VTKRTLRCGGLAAILLLAGCHGMTTAQPQFREGSTPQSSTTEAAAASTGSPRRTPAVAAIAVTRSVTETARIPFPTRTVDDPKMDAGEQHVLTPGIPGLRTLTYLVTLTAGRPTAKKLVASVVTKKPVTMIVRVGTRNPGGKPASCNANYSGCVPVAVDVDCVGGGNGPVYIRGPVKVLGIDIYHLDLDGDGVACSVPEDIP
jgi:hypothetical protein